MLSSPEGPVNHGLDVHLARNPSSQTNRRRAPGASKRGDSYDHRHDFIPRS